MLRLLSVLRSDLLEDLLWIGLQPLNLLRSNLLGNGLPLLLELSKLLLERGDLLLLRANSSRQLRCR